MQHTFKKPNLESTNGAWSKAFISIRANRNTVGVSQGAIREMEITDGDHFHLAFDRTGHPWVGVVQQQTEQREPRIKFHDTSGCEIDSRLLVRHLLNTLDEEPDGCFRFYFDGETADDPQTGATLYKLDLP